MTTENPSSENRGRRVTDQHGGLLDAAQQAVRMERLEGQHALLAQRVSAGMEAVTNSMASVQIEVRGVSAKLGEFAGFQHVNNTNRESIADLKRMMGDLNSRLEEFFDDFEQRNQRRWETYEANRDQWRREHEAANARDKRELEREIRGVRETTIRFAAFGAAIAVLGGTIVGGFLWNINYRFDEGKDDIAETRQTTGYNRSLVDAMNKELVDIKLYLARGGRIPEEAYVPKSQRKENGHESASSKPAE